MSKPQRLRIRTTRVDMTVRPKGQDTMLEIVNEDGTTTPVPDVKSVYWWVSDRTSYCTAIIVVHAEADVEATVFGDDFIAMLAQKDVQLSISKARIAELELLLEEEKLGEDR